jgi:rsbT co-antagonist protein RsbR
MTKEYIRMLEEKIKEYEEVISLMSAPVIPSIIPSTILVPITGLLVAERFEKIREKIMQYIQKNEVETAIIDFTDITIDRIEQMGLSELGIEIDQLTKSVRLMGVEPYFVGLSPVLIREIVLTGINLRAETFSDFQAALKYLMKKKGLSFSASDN